MIAGIEDAAPRVETIGDAYSPRTIDAAIFDAVELAYDVAGLAILRDLEVRSRATYVSPVDLAALHVQFGEADAALAALERGYMLRVGDMADLKVNPLFDALRGDPRFVELLRRLGLAD